MRAAYSDSGAGSRAADSAGCIVGKSVPALHAAPGTASVSVAVGLSGVGRLPHGEAAFVPPGHGAAWLSASLLLPTPQPPIPVRPVTRTATRPMEEPSVAASASPGTRRDHKLQSSVLFGAVCCSRAPDMSFTARTRSLLLHLGRRLASADHLVTDSRVDVWRFGLAAASGVHTKPGSIVRTGTCLRHAAASASSATLASHQSPTRPDAAASFRRRRHSRRANEARSESTRTPTFKPRAHCAARPRLGHTYRDVRSCFL